MNQERVKKVSRKIVLQLNEHDAQKLLELVKHEAGKGVQKPYWQRLATEIQQDIDAQYGQFFQCIACHDD